MKVFTDLEQGRKLTEILPIESADMYWWYASSNFGKRYYIEAMDDADFSEEEGHIRAWSLASLLDILKDNIKIEKTGLDQSDIFTYSIIGDGYDYKTNEHEELINACYEMIVKLHEKSELVL